MSDYREITVYSPQATHSTGAFLCKGRAIDRAKRDGLSDVLAHTLLIPKEMSKKSLDTVNSVWYAVSYGWDEFTGETLFRKQSPFYLSREEADKYFSEEAKSDDIPGQGYYVQDVEFSARMLKAPDKFLVLLERDSKGKLSCQINSHPESDGSSTRGKRFFPDKSWTDATAGWADVTVAKEFDSYGFITGTMRPDVKPTLKTVLDLLWETGISTTAELFVAGSFDKPEAFYLRKDREYVLKPIVYSVQQESLIICEGTDTATKDFFRSTPYEHQMLFVLFAADAWDVSYKELNELLRGFTESAYYQQYKRGSGPRLDVTWAENAQFMTAKDVLGDAVNSQWVTPVVILGFPDIQLYTFSLESISGAMNLSVSEFTRLGKQFTAANAKADALIRAKTQHKKINVLPSRRYY